MWVKGSLESGNAGSQVCPPREQQISQIQVKERRWVSRRLHNGCCYLVLCLDTLDTIAWFYLGQLLDRTLYCYYLVLCLDILDTSPLLAGTWCVWHHLNNFSSIDFSSQPHCLEQLAQLEIISSNFKWYQAVSSSISFQLKYGFSWCKKMCSFP